MGKLTWLINHGVGINETGPNLVACICVVMVCLRVAAHQSGTPLTDGKFQAGGRNCYCWFPVCLSFVRFSCVSIVVSSCAVPFWLRVCVSCSCSTPCSFSFRRVVSVCLLLCVSFCCFSPVVASLIASVFLFSVCVLCCRPFRFLFRLRFRVWCRVSSVGGVRVGVLFLVFHFRYLVHAIVVCCVAFRLLF